ncbi:MAG TPA: hypothetical protein VL728_17525 [Cyclobacteriaceae bacterium]|jgi:hypothetical protein|nr:hypothetical protein [Cyclobacteriaceae bacterium]
MQENRISIQISVQELQMLITHIGSVNAMIGSRLVTLSDEERQTLPKMKDGTVAFVQKALDYCQTNPEFVPVYIGVGDLEIDLTAVKDLMRIFRPLQQITQAVEDSMMLAGSEAYVAALAYYNSVKHAAKMKVPGAQKIYDDMSARFNKFGKKRSAGDGPAPQP